MTARAVRQHQRGVSLVELIVFIVIVSVAMVGLLSVLNMTAGSSSDPMVRKQALALAEATMEEVLASSYQNDVTGDNNADLTLNCTKDTVPSCKADTPGDRPHYNDVDDYNGWGLVTPTVGAYQKDGSEVKDGSGVALLADYKVVIVVGAPAILHGGVLAKKVTVTVTRGAETVVLTGYRTNYG